MSNAATHKSGAASAGDHFKRDMKIQVRIHLPWSNREWALPEFTVSEMMCRESFQPLPKDREINLGAALDAQGMRWKRSKLCDHIARKIASEIMKTVEDQDTVNGYTKEELEDA